MRRSLNVDGENYIRKSIFTKATNLELTSRDRRNAYVFKVATS